LLLQVVVLASFADMGSATTIGSKLLAFRTLRVVRFLRESSLHRIIKACYKFIPAVLGVCAAVLLVIFIYAIIGTQASTRSMPIVATLGRPQWWVYAVCCALHLVRYMQHSCPHVACCMLHLCCTQALRTGAADQSFGDLSDGIFTLFLVGTTPPRYTEQYSLWATLRRSRCCHSRLY
jgi:hypothetical protein